MTRLDPEFQLQASSTSGIINTAIRQAETGKHRVYPTYLTSNATFLNSEWQRTLSPTCRGVDRIGDCRGCRPLRRLSHA